MAKLFAPQENNDLKLDYPELREYKEFKRLTPRQMKFAYFMGNRSSPYVKNKTEFKFKVEYSLRDSGLKNDITDTAVNNYKNNQFDDSMQMAIDKMASFCVSERTQAKIAQDAILSMTIEMIHLSEKDIDSADAKKRGEVLSFLVQANKELPSMLRAKEVGFGITIDDENDEQVEDGTKLMDSILK